MATMREKFHRIRRYLVRVRPEGHSEYFDANDHWVTVPKPYERVDANATFYDVITQEPTRYFEFPNDVRTDFLSDEEESITNQNFFVDLMVKLSEQLNNPSDKEHRDPRRHFHIVLTRDTSIGVQSYPGASPLTNDYRSRMSQKIRRPVWHGFMGLKLIPSTMGNDEAYSAVEKMKRQLEMLRNPDSQNYYLYMRDNNIVEKLMGDAGFDPIDFSDEENNGDVKYKALTAWHGVEDEDYNIPRALSNTKILAPIHGKSVITPKWGEMAFYAIKPLDEMFGVDPTSNFAQFAKALYSPRNNVVSVSIRGQIRKAEVATAIYSQRSVLKREKYRKQAANLTQEDADKRVSFIDRVDEARAISKNGMPLLDHVEIVVGVIIQPGQPSTLNQALSKHGLTAKPLLERQFLGLAQSFPCYSKPVFPQSISNSRRNPLSNHMFPGVIAFSGIFKNTKTAAPRGIIIGLTDSNSEFKEVQTDIEGANKRHKTPGMLVTGRPGAGKTQQMLQMLAQSFYAGYRNVFMNPKRNSTLKPFFDNLGGTTIIMSEEYLSQNPGLLDPKLYLTSKEAADVLNENISLALKLSSNTDFGSIQSITQLKAEIKQLAENPLNETSWEVIFGREDGKTTGISNESYRETIKNRIGLSPFWKAFISQDVSSAAEFKEMLNQNKPVLIEWSKSLSLPNSSEKMSEMSDNGLDSLLSIQTVFRYAVEITGNSRAGGVIFIDEAWVLKRSEQSMRMVDGSLREFREANIMLVLGTQRLVDFMDSESDMDFTSYFDRILIMAISRTDDVEIDKYYKLTSLPRTPENTTYICDAGVEAEDPDQTGKRKRVREVPRAYYIDNIYDFQGGIICGPWPARELGFGRSDSEGAKMRGDINVEMLNGSQKYYSDELLEAVIDNERVLDNDYMVDNINESSFSVVGGDSNQYEIDEFKEERRRRNSSLMN